MPDAVDAGGPPRYAPTPDQTDLRTATRGFLTRHAELRTTRARAETPAPALPDWWARAHAELGLGALGVPEAAGGWGLALDDLAVVVAETGRLLLSGPFLTSSLIGAALIARFAAPDESRRLLAGVVDGSLVVTSSWPYPAGPATVVVDGSGLASGRLAALAEGACADVALIVVAGPGHARTLVEVDLAAPGVQRRPVASMDPTRPRAVVDLDAVAVRELGPPRDSAVLDEVLDLAAVYLAAESVGAAEQMVELTTEYARNREQFGRAIGSFQAVKHQCADMLVRLETARSVLLHAVWSHRAEPGSFGAHAAMAALAAGEAFVRIAETAVHLHGGVGFTWEHDAHLYFKRAHANRLELGGPSRLRERVLAA